MDWILQNGNQVGVVIILMALVFATHKQWIVPGWVYKKAEEAAAKSEKERDLATDELKKQNTTLADLVSYLKQRPPGEKP